MRGSQEVYYVTKRQLFLWHAGIITPVDHYQKAVEYSRDTNKVAKMIVKKKNEDFAIANTKR